MFVASQIEPRDLDEAVRAGLTLIVNNRPDGEEPDQPSGEDIATAAQERNLAYTAIPITHSGFSDAQVDTFIKAIADSEGPVLGYCRSGTRSAFLWALAQAKRGADPGAIESALAEAGYDMAPIRPSVEMLAAQRHG